MPPKKGLKDEEDEPKGAARFGRVKNNLKMGARGDPPARPRTRLPVILPLAELPSRSLHGSPEEDTSLPLRDR